MRVDVVSLLESSVYPLVIGSLVDSVQLHLYPCPRNVIQGNEMTVLRCPRPSKGPFAAK